MVVKVKNMSVTKDSPNKKAGSAARKSRDIKKEEKPVSPHLRVEVKKQHSQK